MEWQEEAIILGVRPHGETSAIVEVMTRQHGRHMGVLKGGRSRRFAPLLQAGNCVLASWWARLDEHLGAFRFEPIAFWAARCIAAPQALYALQIAAAHLRLLPERDPHPTLYDGLQLLLNHCEEPLLCAELLVRFEVLLLAELGFGLDLSACVATGNTDDLIYVSPKSARAVCAQAGQPWKDRLLALPLFLAKKLGRPSNLEELQKGFALTHYFLYQNVWGPRQIEPPMIRDGFIRLIERQLLSV
ncbi:DNA repair protein RecO [Bartonella sp. DGB2]|uniref:DNA repair protein RecO n=1 Tax=Bartonella sp. DGB2 TaxID=3388426 RepID=UPI00399009D4